MVAACGAANGGPTEDGGKTADAAAADTGPNTADASFDAAATSVVFVDGVVNGFATGVDGQALSLADVRVCVFDEKANVWITPHAQPYATPMPLTNYPGIRQGSGVDLGSIPSDIRIDVYSTQGLEADAAWSPSPHTCDAMKCAGIGLPCVQHVSFPGVKLTGGVNVIALVDDPDTDAGFGVKLAQRSFIEKPFAGGPNALWGSFVDFSGWNATSTITAYYGDPTKTSTGDVSIAPSPDEISKDLTGQFDTMGVRVDATGGQQSTFGQTLDSIAYVANGAVTPPVFYGVRQNFVFALVGDPNDLTVNAQGGRNPKFDRSGLHVAAIPYAEPHETQ